MYQGATYKLHIATVVVVILLLVLQVVFNTYEPAKKFAATNDETTALYSWGLPAIAAVTLSAFLVSELREPPCEHAM
jgi:hypothetical protein